MIWCILNKKIRKKRSTGFPYFIREFLHLSNKELGIKLTKEKNDEILRCYLNQQKGEEHPEQRRKTKKKVLKRKEVATNTFKISLRLFLLCLKRKKQKK